MSDSVARVHVVEGRPWKDAVMSVLQPAPPFDPWVAGDVEVGDVVVAVLDTAPRMVMAVTGVIGPDGDVCAALHDAINDVDPFEPVELVGCDVVAADTGFEVAGAGALRDGDRLVDYLAGVESGDMSRRYGHSSAAEARVLVDAGGWCAVCSSELAPGDTDARDSIYIHTVDGSYADWPGVLCGTCRDEMTDSGHAGLLDFRYAQHPNCPVCSARRTRKNYFGLHRPWNLAPWFAARGCVITPQTWVCGQCRYEW